MGRRSTAGGRESSPSWPLKELVLRVLVQQNLDQAYLKIDPAAKPVRYLKGPQDRARPLPARKIDLHGGLVDIRIVGARERIVRLHPPAHRDYGIISANVVHDPSALVFVASAAP